jgi:hypothetical protein
VSSTSEFSNAGLTCTDQKSLFSYRYQTANFLDQAKSLASSAVSQASETFNTIASHPTVRQATNTVQIAASNAATQAGPVLQNAAAQGKEAAQKGFTQAHAAAHKVAPNYIPTPAATTSGNTLGAAPGSIDRSHVHAPSNLESTIQGHTMGHAKDLQAQNILKGEPGDALAGKKKELEGAMVRDKLEGELQGRRNPEELVKEGILRRE